MVVTREQRHLKTADASNRAIRTFFQGLAIDVIVAVVLLLATVFVEHNSWGDLEWGIIIYSVVKTILVTIASYVMRRFLDRPGSIALPPNPPGEPAEPAPPPDLRGGNPR